jgi:hypothetical protein
MKSKLLAASAMLLTMAIGAPALAQQPLPSALGGAGAFHDFLESHPRIRADLEKNPNLVNNPGYVEDHPAFNQFYRNHPEVRGELKENAPDFMRREEWAFKHPAQYQRSESHWKAGVREQREDQNMDKYLDSHPNAARKLEQNPGLANNPAFLKNHPGCAHFEETHPGVEQQMRNHPRKFMNGEENYERKH